MENRLNIFPFIHRQSSPFEVVEWLTSAYSADQVVLTTSFGMEGCALISMLDRKQFHPTVADIDTEFLFEETRQLRSKVKTSFPDFRYETWHPELTPAEQAVQYGDELWKRDPSLCCKLRKIRPLQKNIGRFRIWITGIRKSQSESRGHITPIQWDWQTNTLKICPLANWERSDVWQYVRAHDVPYNNLHKQGYPSIGCTHCTQKVDGLVNLSTYSRHGRWSRHQKTECGIHIDNSIVRNSREDPQS